MCILFRAWGLRAGFRIIISMIVANYTSAGLGFLFVNSEVASRIMGDVTIENLIPAFWTMVYVTFVLTLVVEFPFFLLALKGRKWLIPKSVATALLTQGISYTLLFNWYTPDYIMSMVTTLDIVPASAIKMKEDYDLYYISPDGKYVLRCDLAGNDKEVIATLGLDGIPDRLCACPRKVTEEMDQEDLKTIQRVCWESGFDLYVLMNVNGVYQTKLLFENFSPHSGVTLGNGEYDGRWNIRTEWDFGDFRSLGDEEGWHYSSGDVGSLVVNKVGPYTTAEVQNALGQGSKKSLNALFMVDMPFVQWSVRNGTNVAGKYGVFKLGKDQICILDPEKRQIALICRGFGPVVAKPPLEETPE